MTDDVRTQLDGRLLRITLDRPKDNAVSDGMAAELSRIVLGAHETADAVLLRSVGPDFCTGRARNAGAPPPAAEAYARRPEYDAIFNSYRAVRNAQVPVIGVFEGRVMGFGAAIAALCDVSFASTSATFNMPEMAHGVMPTMVTSALSDRISRNVVLWMAYSTDFIDAHKAMTYGFVSTVVEPERLDAEVERFCGLLLSRPRPAILGLKEFMRIAPRMDELAATDYARSFHSMVNTAAAMKKPA